MRRILILVVIFYLYSISASSQERFTKLIVKNNEARAYNICEIENSSYIFCGTEIPDTGFSSGYLSIIDNTGNIIKQTNYFDTTGDVLFMNIFKKKHGYTIIGTTDSLNVSRLLIVNTDSNLSITSKHTTAVNFNNATSIVFITSILDLDSNFFITGLYVDTTRFGVIPFLLRMDSLGNILAEKHQGFNDSSFYVYNAIEVNNRYRVLVAAYENGGNQILTFDKALNYISKSIVTYSSGSLANIKEYIDDSIIVFVGPHRKGNNIDILVVSYDTLNNVIDSVIVGDSDTLEYACFFNSLSIQNGNIYTGATSNIDVASTYYGNGLSNSSFLIYKFDKDLNMIWTKKFFYPNSYLLLLDIYATLDGGCILLGTRQNNNSSVQKNDILIIKLDSNGTTTWIQNIATPNMQVDLFPNPASNTLNLKLSDNTKRILDFRILDLQGKIILQKQPNQNQTQIDISHLAAGLYIIEGQTQSGAVFRRKFIKE